MGPHSRRLALLRTGFALLSWLFAAGLCGPVNAQTLGTQATSVPLLLPGGLAFDAAGDLIFAESGSHVVREVTPAGTLVLLAGTGVQGFSGDGGPANAAELDSPAAVAVGADGTLFIADAHNHRIRRVDAVTGVISTFAGTGVPGSSPDGTPAPATRIDLPVALAVNAAGVVFFADARTHLVRRVDAATLQVRTVAGSGLQGFAGDGGPATGAALDSPNGLALDAAGNLFVADTHNQRVRRVDAVTGTISTVAGSGLLGFAGDQGAASGARLALPRGLAVDAAGNLFVVDSANQRIRRVDAASGQIVSVAGSGVQGFAGDGGPAVSASVNSPRAVALSPGGLTTLADSGNGRLRQVDAAGVMHTYAGLGASPGTSLGEVLALSAPSVVRYGTGSLTANLTASPASGQVTFFVDAVTPQPLGVAVLNGNAAALSTATLAAGNYRLEATYGGDSAHAPAASNVLSLTVAPAPVVISPDPVALLYGQAIPALTGSLSGVLPQDAGAVSLNLSSAAVSLSPPGAYPIAAALSGPAAGNYTADVAAAAVTIAQAPATATLTQAAGQIVSAHIASTTTGTPTGIVTLLDGANLSSSATLAATGDVSFAIAGLPVGSHTLSAAYQGDTDFRPVTSAPVLLTIAPAFAADFTLAATGQTAVNVPAGSAAQFAFAVMPVNGPLPSAVVLAASGLPRGAVASFNPAFLPPSGGPAAFILTVQTPRAALARGAGPVWALLLMPALFALARRRRVASACTLVLLVCAPLLLMTGCGNRIYTAPVGSGTSYNVTVTGTATSASGTVLVHSATVVMTVD